MKHSWGKKIVNFLHFTIVWYKRIFIVLLALILGTALLSIYSLIDIVNSAAMVVKDNIHTMTIILSIIIIIPTVTYILEKGINAYIEGK